MECAAVAFRSYVRRYCCVNAALTCWHKIALISNKQESLLCTYHGYLYHESVSGVGEVSFNPVWDSCIA